MKSRWEGKGGRREAKSRECHCGQSVARIQTLIIRQWLSQPHPARTVCGYGTGFDMKFSPRYREFDLHQQAFSAMIWFNMAYYYRRRIREGGGRHSPPHDSIIAKRLLLRSYPSMNLRNKYTIIHQDHELIVNFK